MYEETDFGLYPRPFTEDKSMGCVVRGIAVTGITIVVVFVLVLLSALFLHAYQG
jgi:hypothetical protein